MSSLRKLGKATAAILKSLIAPQVGRNDLADAIGYIENAGAPSAVVPDFIGQTLFDTTNSAWYKSYGVASGEWIAQGDNTLSAAELAFLDGALATNLVASKAAITGTGGALTLGGSLTAVGSIIIGSADLNEADIEQIDGITAGTLAASKAWTSDASLDTVMPAGGLLTVQSGGAVTFNSGSTLTFGGAVVQAPVFVADATPYAVLADNSGKLHIILEQANTITLNLPVIAAGLSYKFVMGGVATEAQNWVIVATTPSFYNGGVSWDDSNAVASPVPVYGNGTSHLTLTATTPEAGTAIEIYSNGTEWFVCGAVFSAATPAFS